MSTETEKQVQNGVNVDALLGARDALSKAPEAAKFNWKASCKWMNGTHSQTSIQGFYGLGSQQSHKISSPSTPTIPDLRLRQGATPVEMVLAGLAGCLTAGVASISSCARSSCARQGYAEARWTRASSASTATCATAKTTSGELRDRRRRFQG
jgi:hypothetical protein